MTLFEAIVHAMTTVSTGGFSTSDQSFGQFPGITVYWVAILFMLASSVPFLYLIRSIERRRAAYDVQIALLLVIILTAAFGFFTSNATSFMTRRFTCSRWRCSTSSR